MSEPAVPLVLSRITIATTWVNNPTLGEFCFTMIGRADIEGSKSDVAMNAWPPQASYPCGNFSDTSCLKPKKPEGSQTPHLPLSPGQVAPETQWVPGLGLQKREPAGGSPPCLTGARLESSSTGSSFPADSAKPVPLAVVSLDSR
ncbi:hypothetical protein HZH68_017171 [Vespula germanica]|uniref:Uncharacterized protein n=1 Tax=Vespula germanica TaxID=30212 RepID=A0A834IXV1_VESGE|nr:hypothetical protein HZH68_017171 [Vespula germanica]